MHAEKIMLAHGSGGTLMRALVEDVFVAGLSEEALSRLDDAASLTIPGSRIAFSTDTYVVTPHFFPGGDIGRLAVCGTVNDVATSGARPLYLSMAVILEEGMAIQDLHRILESMRAAAREANVHIVTGDTKVVERGHGDGIYINTAGIGVLRPGTDLSGSYAREGDVVLLSGTLGDHGITIISCREGLGFEADISSDAAPLAEMCAAVLEAAPDTRCFRDPTRGGLASALNEIATASNVPITVKEADVPVKPQVKGASEMLGYDVFQVANEGKMAAIVPEEQAEAALAAMRGAPYGSDAAIIGRVAGNMPGRVYVETAFGATRIMDMLVGEQLPRIC
ncbi:MAG: hydrogenase expression/formation protein HypE [Coriobacteriia bacterium]|nr:hydrogenase expression/formation protein HypE [Coriobacteriia bacterium]